MTCTDRYNINGRRFKFCRYCYTGRYLRCSGLRVAAGGKDVYRGDAMKKMFILSVAACCLIVWLGGCSCPVPVGSKGCAQLGETEAEGNRRHLRNARINHAELLEDLDTVFLYDSPSRLTHYRIP